jgi:hypothetical protein
MLRLAMSLMMMTLAGVAMPVPLSAQGSCEAMSPGTARTDCIIARGRIARQKANLSSDKARAHSGTARLRAVTGGSSLPYRAVCSGKGAGTRACYTCCRTHGLSASRCLRRCRQP